MNWDWDKLQQKSKQKKQQSPGSGGGGLPPEMDEFFQKLKEFKFSGGPVIIAGIAVVLLIAYSTFFTIKSGEIGVIQRFGRFARIAEPGPNFKWPAGIEKLTKVNQEVYRTEDFESNIEVRGGRVRYSAESDTGNASLMLTGDLNVALVPWVIQYKVDDPYKWLFKVEDRIGLLRNMAEASMRLVVGDKSINEVIKREGISLNVKNILQKSLNDAETGIHIEAVKLSTTNVPSPVQPSFNEVNQATQEKEKMVYEANKEYFKAIPAAKGEAERVIKAAEGYAAERINKAQGDAARFLSIYNEYKLARDVTRRRMYLEMIRDLFPKLGQTYIIDSEQKNVLPLLNLVKQEGEIK